MKLIDPQGLFAGDRFSQCSDLARLYWPFFWCVSNGFGRLELSFAKISEAFRRFHQPPDERAFWGFIAEYQKAHLLFVYEVDGAYWGQWDSDARYLPRWKTADDKASPSPDETAYNKWLTEYTDRKRTKASQNRSCVDVSEILRENFGGSFLAPPNDFGKSSPRDETSSEELSCVETSSVETNEDGIVLGVPNSAAPPSPPPSVRPSRNPRQGKPFSIPEAKPIAPPPRPPGPPGADQARIDGLKRLLWAYMAMAGTEMQRNWPQPDDGVVVRCLVAIGDRSLEDVGQLLRQRYATQSPRHPNGPKAYAWFPTVLEQAFGQRGAA